MIAMYYGERWQNMRITDVRAADNYILIIEFEGGSCVNFSMKRMVETIPYMRLRDPVAWKSVKFEDKAVYWDSPDGKPEIVPMRVTADEILFSLR